MVLNWGTSFHFSQWNVISMHKMGQVFYTGNNPTSPIQLKYFTTNDLCVCLSRFPVVRIKDTCSKDTRGGLGIGLNTLQNTLTVFCH